MPAAADLHSARRIFLLLSALRWLPTGITVPILVIFATGRGLSLTEVGLLFAAQAVIVTLLELPTGGLADAWGRRPVLLLAAALAVASSAAMLGAYTFLAFLLARVLQGMFRALDSGPLEAWYVDAVLATDPGRDLSGDLAKAGFAIYTAIGAGSLLSAGIVTLPLLPVDPLTAVVAVSLLFEVTHLVAVAVLLKESRPAAGWPAAKAAVVAVPAVVRAGTGLAWRLRPLRLLLAVELSWGFGLVAVEALWQPQLAAVSGPDRQDWLFGVLSAAGWVAGAGGALLVKPLTRLCGRRVSLAAAVMRIAQSATCVLMALAAGPIGVATAYIGFYVVHGAANPAHFALLHARVGENQRATALSINSLVSALSAGAGSATLGVIADGAGLTTALLLGSVMLGAATPLYLLSGEPDRAAGRASAGSGTGPGTGLGTAPP